MNTLVPCRCGGRRDSRARQCRPCRTAERRRLAALPPVIDLDRSVDKSGGPDACWPWLGVRRRSGYGQFGRKALAHRAVYEAARGPIPPGMELLHSCDNPPCVNPRHLRPGTHAENMAEAAARGLLQIGEQRYNHRLTPEAVRRIRRLRGLGQSDRSIARTIGVSPGTVHAVLIGRTWRHVA